MVNSRVDIAQVFENAKELNAEHIEQLNVELASKPWCSAYRMLLAKGYDNQGSYLKNKTLRLAATYAGDREQLFALIYDQEVVWKGKHKTTEAEEKVEEEEIEKPIVVEKIQPKVEELGAEEEALEKSVVDEEQETEKFEVAKTETVAETIEEIVKTSDKVEEIDSEEPEVEAEPKEGKIDFDKIVTYDPLEQLTPLEKERNEDRVSLPFDFVAYDPEKELEKLIEDKKEAENGGEQDFLYWLNNVKEDQEPVAKNEKSPDVVQDLLDKFLATKRNVRLKHTSFYKAEEKAEESETDNMDIISETLLELYVKQGHYSKAIEGYEKLSLLNPLKSTYFAARIKEIKNLEKDQ